MKIAKKKDFIWILLALAFICLVAFEPSLMLLHQRSRLRTQLKDLQESVEKYIEDNHGHFPQDQNSLLSQIECKEKIELFIDKFVIYYGVSPNDFEVIDNKLFNKNTKEKILLIRGPKEELMQEDYENTSFDLYQKMMRE